MTRRPWFRRDEEPVLAVDVAHIDRITSLARQARQLNAYPVGDLACFNVDLSREFRYCLEEDVDPTPAAVAISWRVGIISLVEQTRTSGSCASSAPWTAVRISAGEPVTVSPATDSST